MAFSTLQSNNTSRVLPFFLVLSSDHLTGATGKAPTVKISKNGAAGVSPAGAVSETDSVNLPGWYMIAANATDANTLGPLALHATATGCDPADYLYDVVAYNRDDAVRAGLTALPNAAAGATGGLDCAVSLGGTASAGGANTITLTGGVAT